MYTYQYAVGRYHHAQPGFHVVDISTFALNQLSTIFSVLDIVLYDERFKRLIAIHLDDYIETFNQDKRTLITFLKDNPSITLTYSLTIPKNTLVNARWESPCHAGFYPHPANITLSSDKQDKLTADSAPDIRLLRDNVTYTAYKQLSDYALFIVNGCFTRAEGINTGLYLRGAGKDYQHHKQTVSISAINFEKIGKLTTIPITKAMIRTDEAGRKVFLDLAKNTDLANKTVWVVFNGQLLVNEDIISQVSPLTLMLDMGYVDLSLHYFTYRQYTRTPTWTDQTQANQYTVDALCAENSFLILIDNPTVGVTLTPMVKYTYPLSHQTQDSFPHPVMLENGLFPYCFRRTYGVTERIVNTDIGHLVLPILDSTGTLSDNLLYTESNQAQPGTLPRAYLFEITGTVT